MKFFLNAKGWQLFLVLFGTTFGAQILVLHSKYPVVAIALGTLVFMAPYFGWLWAIAAAANKKLELPLKRSTKWMAIGLAYAGSYVVGALFVVSDSMDKDQGVPGFIIPMHILAMIAIFYVLIFTAKRLVTLERKQQVTFFDYSGPFFLLWFFPIGVWFIQPRVNKLLGAVDT